MALLPVPSPRTFGVSEIETGGYLNSLRDALNFLLNTPIGVFYQTAAQSVANAAFTAAAFDTTGVDSYSGHSNSTNNSRYAAVVPGWYELSGSVGFVTNGTGNRDGVWAKNGSALTAPGPGTIIDGSAGHGTAGAVPTLPVFLNVGDYVELQLFQSSGAAVNTITGQFGCLMSVKWIHA
jgi:hypothetical protein